MPLTSLLLFPLVLGGTTHATAENHDAVKPVPRDGNWMKRHESMNERVKKGNVDLLLIGDSITQAWEGPGKAVWAENYAKRNAVNLGIGGDRTEHVIWRLTHGNLGKIKPKVAVLMIGTNNTGHFMQDPSQVAEGVAEILQILSRRLPDTQVILHGVFPRGAMPLDEGRLNNIAINDQIRKFADGKRVHYLDIGHVFLESDGSISKETMPDYLHLSADGYQRWADALEPKLVELGL